MNGKPKVWIEDTVPLKRRLGFFSGTALIIGGIVGKMLLLIILSMLITVSL